MPYAPYTTRYKPQMPFAIPGVMSPLEDTGNVSLDPMSAYAPPQPPSDYSKFDPTPMPAMSKHADLSAPNDPEVAFDKPSMPPPQLEAEEAPDHQPDTPDDAPPPADLPQNAPSPKDGLIVRGPQPPQPADTAKSIDPYEQKQAALLKEREDAVSERPTYKTNIWKDLGAAVLSLGKFAPIAQQITHPRYTQQMNQYQNHVADISERQKALDAAQKISAEAEKNRAAADKNERERLKDSIITVPGGGIFNLKTMAWEQAPVDKNQLVEIDPNTAKEIGLALVGGKAYIPKEAVGSLISATKAPKPLGTIDSQLMDVWRGIDPPEVKQAKIKELVSIFKQTHSETPIHGIETDAKGNSTLVIADPSDPTKAQKIPLGPIGKPQQQSTPADRGESFVDPTGTLVRVQPGQQVPQGGMRPTQFGSANAPTTQMRNVAAQAGLVHEQTPMMLAQIDKLKGKLGPVSGRWNEFMQGHVGMDDADMAGLRADLLMYSSAVALMHARGRLPENLRKEFDEAINAPKQTADNLKAVITRIDNWTAKNMDPMGGNRGGQENNSTAKQSHKVGDVVSLRDGTKGTISVVHPDGTFDIK